jgi:hypothetical protein
MVGIARTLHGMNVEDRVKEEDKDNQEIEKRHLRATVAQWRHRQFSGDRLKHQQVLSVS